MHSKVRIHFLLALIFLLTGTSAAQWNSATDLPYARWSTACCAHNGYVYTIGGEQSGIAHNNVWYSETLEDGSIGPWLSTSSLPGPRMYHGCFIHNNFLFVLGGWGSGSTRSNVWSAEIQADGSIGSWTSTTDLPSPRNCYSLAVCNGYVYVAHGSGVIFAQINDNGTIGVWESTTSLPGSRTACRCFAFNDYLYVTGGHSSSLTYYNNVWFAQSQPDGTIGSWTSTAPLPAISAYHGCCVEDGNVYITGGQNISSYYNTASTAGIQISGPLDSWVSFPNIPEARSGHGYCSYDGYLYIIGGTNWSGNLKSVRYAHISSVEVSSREHQSLPGVQTPLISPNPFHGSTQIHYSLSEPAHVTIRIYDCSGRMIKNLTDEEAGTGEHCIFWHSRDSSGNDIPPGVYYYTLSVNSSVFTGCLVNLK
ncbi:MAG: T9SS type A sorting domain-containing protein [Candidatus Sabulitectum sp.]|nr:T9SS type A sorting domain-containing protein [Candidatus Sabulitectum sp.]